MKTPIIILAAGSSSRLGQAKQLLERKEEPLISYVIKECLSTQLGEVIVVLGSNHSEIRKAVDEQNCMVIINEEWKEGQGSSIACGAGSLDESLVDGVFIVLVDQVHFNRDVLLNVDKKRKETNASIVLSQYAEGAGPPSYFDSSHLPALCDLNGERGAKPIVKAYKDRVEYISFTNGHLDIDTPEDLQRLADI